MKVVNANEFNEITAKGLVLVDFFADWCGPCKMLAPILEEVATEVTGVEIVKLNVDEENEIAAKYNVMSIPTMILFKDGVVVETATGFKAKPQILDIIAKGQ